MNDLIQHEISARAAMNPAAVAVAAADQSLTYGALEMLSNQLARLLLAVGCRRGDRIGLLMPKRPAAIVAMLGALKADTVYVPLDPAEPASRLARILAAADCRCVLAAGPVGTLLHQTLMSAQLQRQPVVGWLDGGMEPDCAVAAAFRVRDLEAFATTLLAGAGDSGDVAHILFTSGSTGTPKGVMISHASVLAFLRWAGTYFGIDASDRIAQHAPFRFDLSTFDIYGALRAGATLCLVPPELNLQPPRLARFVRDSRITHWLTVPSVLNLVARFDALDQPDFPDLRRLLFAGEVLPTPTLIHWMRRLPHVRFTNLYGPTETTIASSHYTVPACPDSAVAPIPIGRACDGEELLVLDDQGQPLPDGQIGDIHIKGVGLSPGYWRDESKTAGAFLSRQGADGTRDRIYRTGDRGWRDGDGQHHFVGRSDHQIKCRGYRIELGEIERTLHALPTLHDGAIVAIPSAGFEGSLICCAYVPAADAPASPIALRSALATQLPTYMLPMRWRRYESLPTNANGKCDRRRLHQDFQRAEAGGPWAGACPDEVPPEAAATAELSR